MSRKNGEKPMVQSGSVEGGRKDDRSLDELLDYIEGSKEDGKQTRKARLQKKSELWWEKRKKRKNKNKIEQANDSGLAESSENMTRSTHSSYDARQPTDDLKARPEAKVIGDTEVATNEEAVSDSVEYSDEDDDYDVDYGDEDDDDLPPAKPAKPAKVDVCIQTSLTLW